jgi:hypothetical protein
VTKVPTFASFSISSPARACVITYGIWFGGGSELCPIRQTVNGILRGNGLLTRRGARVS